MQKDRIVLAFLLSVGFHIASSLGESIAERYKLVFEILTLTLGIPSALALRSPSRPQILSADFIMILLLWATVNV
jgi:hypothetical protein